MAIVNTVDTRVGDLHLILWQFDTFVPLTPISPIVLDLIDTLEQLNLQKPLCELDVSAELNAWDGSIVIRWHYWIGDRTGNGEVSKIWNAGQITGNAPGRQQIAALVAAGVAHILAQWEIA